MSAQCEYPRSSLFNVQVCSHHLVTLCLTHCTFVCIQARVQGGGARGLPPPLEMEKQKKKSKKKGHQSKFEAISPIFCYFFSRKYNFLSYFLSWAPPPPKKAKKKKKGFQILGPPPPLRIPGHAPGI